MDLTTELIDLAENKLPTERIIQNLEQDRINLDKKIHTIKIIDFSQKMAELIKTEIPKDIISEINIVYYPGNNEAENKFSLHLISPTGKRINTNIIDSYYRDEYRYLEQLFKSLKNINSSFVNEDFLENVGGKITLNKEIDKQVLELFLSKELQSALEYNKMQIQLEKKDVVAKKHKL